MQHTLQWFYDDDDDKLVEDCYYISDELYTRIQDMIKDHDAKYEGPRKFHYEVISRPYKMVLDRDFNGSHYIDLEYYRVITELANDEIKKLNIARGFW
jgi:hypothetical protein